VSCFNHGTTKETRSLLRVPESQHPRPSGDGFERQLVAIRAYAQANGIKIAKIFREEGVSGTKDLENRPALQDLLTALHSSGVKLGLIEKLDRLARDLMIQESVIADMGRHGFKCAASASQTCAVMTRAAP
jgi:DNA invertase Pin-like site-specific DNA recombinase